MESMSECPVCGGRVLSAGLNSHMASHAKQDIVAALLRQRSPSENLDFSAATGSGRQQHAGLLGICPGSQSQPISLVKKSSGGGDQSVMTSQTFDMSMMPSHSTAGPFIMPQMMGMMQVISPCFIPQPNGPPILVNLPSYIYPNIGMMGGMLAAAANATGSLLPSTSSSTLASNATSSSSSAAGVSFLPSSSSSSMSGISSSGLLSLPPNLLPLQPVSFATASSSTATNTVSPLSSLVEVVVSPSPENSPSTIMMDLATNSDDSIISVDDHKVQDVDHFPVVLEPTQQPKPKSTTDDSSIEMEAKTKKGIKSKSLPSSSGVCGYTRYASDSPYPAASINFSSVMNIDEQRIKHETEDEEEEEMVETEEKSSFGSDIKDESESNQSLEEEEDDDDDENSNVCTVHTLSDLQNALKSEEDIQIVVPNELLETTEFKVFLSSLGPFPITSASAAAASMAGMELSASSEDRVCLAPPNTPAVTRPPSAAPPSSPQPCSSRDLSRSGFNDPAEISDSKCESDISEGGDDITLQDLVAMETMEDDICDDDHFYQMSSSNPLEPYMNSLMRHDDDDDDSSSLASNVFSCYKCGLHFASFGEFNRHKTVCCKWKNSSSSKGVGKKSSKKSFKKFPAPPVDDPLSMDDSNANLDPVSLVKKWSQPIDLDGVTVKSEQSSVLSSADLIRQNSNSASATTVKSETFDSSSQPALAAPGANHWKCNQCRVVFESGPMLWEHLDSMHRAVNKCAVCHVAFADRKQALAHKKKFHPSVAKIKLEPPELTMPNENGEFVCDKCDRAFKDRELLTKHQSCHDEEKPYECLECGKKFSKGTLLRNHRRRHFEVGAFECQLCKKRFYTPNKLREHERIHTGEAPLSCNVCGKTFRRHSNLSEHKRIHLEVRPVKPPKELFCHCGKVFPTQRDLDWHKEGEHDNIPKKCTFCGEIFVHSSSLTRHIRLKHESDFMPTDKKTTLYAKCPICQQTFYKTSINKHIRIKHHGQKPFQCDICKMSFVTKCNLDNHQWQHKGVRARPFKCQQCNKSYLRKSLLDAHMRSHRGVKPYVCNECGLQFANKSNWQRHVAEHSGSRNYPCHLCDKRFSRNYYLSDHLKTHTGEKPFVCGICGKSAATRSNYNSHLRTHITREPVNSEV